MLLLKLQEMLMMINIQPGWGTAAEMYCGNALIQEESEPTKQQECHKARIIN